MDSSKWAGTYKLIIFLHFSENIVSFVYIMIVCVFWKKKISITVFIVFLISKIILACRYLQKKMLSKYEEHKIV